MVVNRAAGRRARRPVSIAWVVGWPGSAARAKSTTVRVEQHLRARLTSPVPEVTLVVTTQAVVGTFLTLLRRWVEAEMIVRPEQMDAYFQRLVLPGARHVLANTGQSPERCVSE